MNRLLALAPLLAASFAHAQLPPLSAHPVEVLARQMTKPQLEAVQSEYRRLLAQAGVSTPSNRVLSSALADLKRQDCSISDECLKKFAMLSGTLYALHVGATQDPQGNATLSARVVRDDGVLVLGPLTTKEVRKGGEGIDATIVRGLASLFAQAKLGNLPPSREAAKPAPVVVVAPPAPVDAGVPEPVKPAPEPVDAGVAFTPPPAPPLEPSPLSSIGTVSLIAGGGVALVGGVLLGVGASVASGLDIRNGAVRADQAQQAVTANTLQGVGAAALAAGGTAAAAGLVMMLLAPSDAPKKLNASVVPVPGGSIVVVGGAL